MSKDQGSWFLTCCSSRWWLCHEQLVAAMHGCDDFVTRSAPSSVAIHIGQTLVFQCWCCPQLGGGELHSLQMYAKARADLFCDEGTLQLSREVVCQLHNGQSAGCVI